MRRLSLRARLNLAFAAMLGLGLVADGALTVESARQRIDPEVANSSALAGDIVRGALAGLHGGPEVAATLADLAARLDHLRHVRVSFSPAGASGPPAQPATDGGRRKPPGWFLGLIRPEAGVQRIEANVDGRSLGTFIVTGDPDDEIVELWDGVAASALDGGAAAAVGWLALSFIVSVSLRPLARLEAGLKALSAGDYRVRLGVDAAPDFVDLLSRFNRLGASLLAAESENQTLRARLVSIQDDERKEVARELHDEIGPHLFAARAQAQFARQSLLNDPERAVKAVDAAIQSIDALQEGNRRILDWLRPAALEELGLIEALEALEDYWARTLPDMTIELDLPQTPPALAPKFQAALYRIAQEAVTNAVRHAGADTIRLALRLEPDGALVLSVADNGAGFDKASARSGLGLLGIRERVATYGGAVDLLPVAPQGFELRASFPRVAIDEETN